MNLLSNVTALGAAVGLSRYGALAAALRARVVSGEWPPGSALPAESLLAAEPAVLRERVLANMVNDPKLNGPECLTPA